MWLDRILVIIGLAGLTLFCGIVMYFVAEPDLLVVMSICLAIAYWDFAVSVFFKRED